jgi:hypothetical protein
VAFGHAEAVDDPYSPDVPPLTAPEDAPPVRSDADLLVRWRQLMGPWGFGRRSLWVLWFDPDGAQIPLVVPIDDIAEVPDERFLDNLMFIVDQVTRADDAEGPVTVAMALSRPGSARLTDSDRCWARALRDHADRAAVHLWPLHLATRGVVRPLTLDDVGWVRPRSA